MNNKEIDTNTSSPMDIENDEGFQQSNEAMARQGGGESTVNCDCGQPSTKKNYKDDANKDREFYCCAKTTDSNDQCSYFQWVDQVEGLRGDTAGGGDDIPSSSHGKGQFMATQGGGEWTVNCDCRETSAKMKVRKDGTNKGREYYCCAKPRDADDHCRYFQWVDEVDGLQGEATGGGDDIPSSSHGKGQFIFFLMRHPQSVKRRHYSVKGE